MSKPQLVYSSSELADLDSFLKRIKNQKEQLDALIQHYETLIFKSKYESNLERKDKTIEYVSSIELLIKRVTIDTSLENEIEILNAQLSEFEESEPSNEFYLADIREIEREEMRLMIEEQDRIDKRLEYERENPSIAPDMERQFYNEHRRGDIERLGF